MKSLTSWLLTIFAILFWVFRVIITFMDTMSIDFFIKAIDINQEMILLFITLLSIILIIKRKILGGLLYLASYGYYFGMDIYNKVTVIDNNIDSNAFTSIIVSSLAIVLALAVLIDLIVNMSSRKDGLKDKKTDWFYRNEKYDRKLDDRADKNNYRIH